VPIIAVSTERRNYDSGNDWNERIFKCGRNDFFSFVSSPYTTSAINRFYQRVLDTKSTSAGIA